MYEFFRWLALITGWLPQLLIFKRKTYYQNKAVQGRRVKGGALVISNHYRVFDYMRNLFLFPFRKLYVVFWPQRNKKRGKFFLWGMRFFGGVASDKDTGSLRFIDESVALLEKGKLLQIYPEARITPDGRMHPFKASYLVIALRAQVPILPVITDGQYGLFKRVHLIIGEPIYPWELCESENPTKEEIARVNEIVYQRCLSLQRELEARKARKKKTSKGE